MEVSAHRVLLDQAWPGAPKFLTPGARFELRRAGRDRARQRDRAPDAGHGNGCARERGFRDPGARGPTPQVSQERVSRISIAVKRSSCLRSSSAVRAGSSLPAISMMAAHSAAERLAKR